MGSWIIVVYSLLLLIQANHAVYDITALVMDESILLHDAIEAVFKISGAKKRQNSRATYLECMDKLDSRSCKYLMLLGACNTRRDSMQAYCEKTCRFCVDPPCHLTRYGCCFDGKTISTGPHMRGCDNDCVDVIGTGICKALKKNGQCYKAASFVRRKCPVTCGYCRPCKDMEPFQCLSSAKYNICSAGKGRILENCRRTCNKCGKKDPCFDHDCPRNSVCRIGNKNIPYCECDGRCKKGDYFTGIVCGRDGKEYKDLCTLKQRNCGHPSIPPVSVKNYGPCNIGLAYSDRRQTCRKKKKESDMCQRWASLGYCKQRRKAMQQICARACNFCSLQSPKGACHYMKFGCCLDNQTPCLNTNYKGCPKYPACKDFSKTFCERFVALCGNQKHQKTLRRYCPEACHFCVPT